VALRVTSARERERLHRPHSGGGAQRKSQAS